jgi:hypothetical protein
VKSDIPCLKEILLNWNQSMMQSLRPHLNHGGRIYTKGKVFEFSSRDPITNLNMGLLIIYIMLALSHSQFKSNNYAKKHLPVIGSYKGW